MRLIDADALQKEYMYEHDGKRLMLIDVAPTIEERKTGKWIGYNTEQDGWKRTDGSPVFMRCSECNKIVLNNGSPHWNFCPNCGSYNGGDKDDQR